MINDNIEPTAFQGAANNILAGDMRGAGQGRPVVLIHGGGQTRHSWAGSAAQLAAQHWAPITYDQRGHGNSDWVEPGHYAVDDYAADAAAVAHQISARFGAPPIAIGASLGGIASLLAQGRDGTCFAGLVLVDITPWMDEGGVQKIQGFMGARMKEGFDSVEAAADAIAAYLPNRKRPRSSAGLKKNLRLDEDGRYRWHWDPRFLDGPRTINTRRDDVAKEMVDAARSLTIPTLLVRGGSSELITEAHARDFLALVPHARFADVTGAGHMVAGDQNDAFTNAITDFLQDVYGGSGVLAKSES